MKEGWPSRTCPANTVAEGGGSGGSGGGGGGGGGGRGGGGGGERLKRRTMERRRRQRGRRSEWRMMRNDSKREVIRKSEGQSLTTRYRV